jgi:RNA polymerase sigma-70 factor (TIGR02960 family)
VTEALVRRAQNGDDVAFASLVDRYQDELRVHCYRLLGSLSDAEDCLQETLLAAWRGLEHFEGRSSVRTWLYRIATNCCLNSQRDIRRRAPAAPIPPFDPPAPSRVGKVTWLQPFPDALLPTAETDVARVPEARYGAKEAIELAFIAVLQRLPARQAAALLLGDVLGYTIAEVAEMLDTTDTAIKGLLQRARSATKELRRTGPGSQLGAATSDVEANLAGRFADAISDGDVNAVVALLTDDAWLAMPPAPHEYHGPVAIASFLRASTAWRGTRRLTLVSTRANGQPAFACYLDEPDAPVAQPAGLFVLTVTGAKISGVTRFLHGEVLAHFGLPNGPTHAEQLRAIVEALPRRPTLR